MLRRFSTNFALFSIAVDTLTIFASLWGVAMIRPALSELPFEFIQTINHPVTLPLVLYALFPFVWVASMALYSVYDGQKNLRIVDEFSSLTMASIQAGIVLAGFLYLSYRDISRVLFILVILLTYFLFLLWRVIARILYWYRNTASRSAQRILIAGAGPVGMSVKERMDEQRHLSVELVGFLDDSPSKAHEMPDWLGALEQVREIVIQKKVTDVIVTLPPRAYQRVNQLVADLHDIPVKVWIVPDYFQLALYQARAESLFDIPMFDLRAPALSESQRILKRAFDVLFILMVSPVAIPLCGLIALAIWFDDGAPVIFAQTRAGENGRLFTMYKFRTMVKNAEQLRHLVEKTDENGNILHKHRDDPRITRVGRFLRKLSLDELPQLYNIFRGHMSWVGPRPELPYLVEKYEPWQRKRFAVPQGLTGWWQIHGRSDKPMHLHTEDDLYYVQNYSIWLDIEILIKTVWIVLRGKGAY
jgi:exopolysaccharide biosynthesis polyprenyl glycosylphosphotransferase